MCIYSYAQSPTPRAPPSKLPNNKLAQLTKKPSISPLHFLSPTSS